MVVFTKCRFPRGSKKRPPENFDKVRVSVGPLIAPGTHNQIFPCLAKIRFPWSFLPNADSCGVRKSGLPQNFDKVWVSVGSLIAPGTHNQICPHLAKIRFLWLFLPNADSRGVRKSGLPRNLTKCGFPWDPQLPLGLIIKYFHI